MVGSEGDVIARMPVFRCDFDSEREIKEFVDVGDNVTTVGDGERSVLFAVVSDLANIIVAERTLMGQDIPEGRNLLERRR